MKRFFKIVAIPVVVMLCGLAGWALQPDHSVAWDSFDAGMRKLDLGPKLRISEIHSLPADAVPLPWSISWNPRRWGVKPPRFLFGFPNSGCRYLFTANGSDGLSCDVRYLDSRAVYFAIRGHGGQEDMIARVRDAVGSEFPGLPNQAIIE